MSVSVAIMAHPRRAHFVDEMREKLPNAQVVWDRVGDRWETGRRAVLAFDPDASHHVVVQDDGLVCEDLVAGVEHLTTFVPDNPISLYTGKTRPFGQQVQRAVRKAKLRRLRWLKLDGLFWGVGVVLPVAVLQEMIRFHDLANVHLANYDSKMSYYFREIGLPVYYTQPSLVDHRDLADGNPSLVPGRWAKGRVAHEFIGEASPLDVDWNTGVMYLRQDGTTYTERLPVRAGAAQP